MGFVAYQHVERLGEDEVNNILDPWGESTTIIVEPKMDGTNATVWFENGEVQAGSRRRKLTQEKDNRGFYEKVKNSQELAQFYANPENRKYRIFGEWLVSNCVKYEQDAYNNLYIFDIIDDSTGEYLPPDMWPDELSQFYIPTLDMFDLKEEKDVEGRLARDLGLTTYKTLDGGPGEGIVIKRYGDWRNKYGHVVWAKIVRDEYKRDKHKGKRAAAQESGIENYIAEQYITSAYCEKEFAKFKENNLWDSKKIPQLLDNIWHEFVTEETWHIIKKYKSPVINFSKLQRAVYFQIKQQLKEVF